MRRPSTRCAPTAAPGCAPAAFISGYQGSPLGGYDRELARHKGLLDAPRDRAPARAQRGAGRHRGDGQPGRVDAFPSALRRCPRRSGTASRPASIGPATRCATRPTPARHRNGGVLALTGDDPACKSSTLPSPSEWALADLAHADPLPRQRAGGPRPRPARRRASRTVGTVDARSRSSPPSPTARAASTSAPSASLPVMPEFESGTAARTSRRPRAARPADLDAHRGRDLRGPLRDGRAVWRRERAQPCHARRADSRGSASSATGRTTTRSSRRCATLGLGTTTSAATASACSSWACCIRSTGRRPRRFAAGARRDPRRRGEAPVRRDARARRALRHGRRPARRRQARPRRRGRSFPLPAPSTPTLLVAPLRRRLAQRIDPIAPGADDVAGIARVARQIDVLPSRTPFFCSGCPHTTGMQVPEGALVGAGIGCHGMVLLHGRQAGRQHHRHHADGRRGRAVDRHRAVRRHRPLLPEPRRRHVLPLRARWPSAAVAAKSHITYKILYNGAVAMTGGQDAAGCHADRAVGHVAARRGRRAGGHHHRRDRQVPGRRAARPASRCGTDRASSRPRRCWPRCPA